MTVDFTQPHRDAASAPTVPDDEAIGTGARARRTWTRRYRR